MEASADLRVPEKGEQLAGHPVLCDKPGHSVSSKNLYNSYVHQTGQLLTPTISTRQARSVMFARFRTKGIDRGRGSRGV